MRENPEQQWFDLRQEAMDRLRGENEALLRRLGELKEKANQTGVHGQVNDGQAVGPDLVPKESFELAMKEKLQLEDVVKQKEKRLLRLQQVHDERARSLVVAFDSLLISYVSRGTGIHLEKCRIPGGYCVYTGREASLLSQRPSARNKHV